jgi:hypothetical protein
MARSIRWKEAMVALNILFCFALLSASAQTLAPGSSISYSCRAEKLESVIDHLSKTTGYDFIYSRDLVDVSKTISLNVKNESLNEVLSLIEKQANVSFKLKDRHIIVKNVPKPAVPLEIITPAIGPSSEAELITSISGTIPPPPCESHTALLQKSLEKRINEVQGMLGGVTPKNIPAPYINQINFNNRHKNWFASIGTRVGNDHSGVEIQAGLPALYAVFNPHWSNGFYGSYGVGNSFNLAGNFSFNTIYLYSSRSIKEMSYPFSDPFVGSGPQVIRTQTIRQHQVKMAIRYSFTKNISVRFGPVLNYLTTIKETSIGATNSMPETVSSAYYHSHTLIIQNQRFESQNSRVVDKWIGWDASIQYRINFYENR